MWQFCSSSAQMQRATGDCRDLVVLREEREGGGRGMVQKTADTEADA